MASGALHFRGVVLPTGEELDLYVVDGRITFEPVASADTIVRSGWIVPGLVDVHCHVGLNPDHAEPTRQELRRQALQDRDVGALALRDCGSPVDTAWLDGEPDLPRLIRAGRHIATAKRYIPGVAAEVSPDDLADEVERQAKSSDGWVKLVGDWIDRGVGDLAPLWSPEQLSAAIARAHALGAKVTAHTFAEQAVADLVAAGIDCIEHGTGIDDSVIAQMVQNGTALVPTVVNVGNFPDFAAAAGKYPAYADHMRRLHSTAPGRVRAAYEAGVAIYAGSDAGGSIPHGTIVKEIQGLADIGLSNHDALGAGAWRARNWLGLQGIEEGASADFVLYDEDPLADLSVLDNPAGIVLRGQQVG